MKAHVRKVLEEARTKNPARIQIKIKIGLLDFWVQEHKDKIILTPNQSDATHYEVHGLPPRLFALMRAINGHVAVGVEAVVVI